MRIIFKKFFRLKPFKQISITLQACIVLVYAAVGISLIFYPPLKRIIHNDKMRIGIGIIIVIYSVFRFFRLKKNFIKALEEPEN